MTDFQTELLPPLTPCEQVRLGPGDVIIVSGGFEDRSLAFRDILVVDEGAQAIVIEYRPEDSRNRFRQAVEALRGIGVEPQIAVFDRYNPEQSLRNMRHCINAAAASGAGKVYVDISALSKLGILMALLLCQEKNLYTVIIYQEAHQYRPTKKEYNKARAENNILQPSLQVYSGIEDVLCISELSSVAMQGQPTCLVAFMSFNDKFLQALLNRLNPSMLFLVNGSPPIHSWREEATAWIHQRLLDEWSAYNSLNSNGLPHYTTSTLDYRQTYDLLGKLYWECFSTHKMILAPSGSKMQAVGSYLFRAVHEDVHIEYPTARGYLDEYSAGVGARWLLELGYIEDLVSKLRKQDIEDNLSISSGPNEI